MSKIARLPVVLNLLKWQAEACLFFIFVILPICDDVGEMNGRIGIIRSYYKERMNVGFKKHESKF